MNSFEVVRVDSSDTHAVNAAIACYMKASLQLNGVEFDAGLSDLEIIAHAAKHAAHGHQEVGLYAAQIIARAARGEALVVHDKAGKAIGIATFCVVSAASLNVMDGRSEEIAVINFFQMIDHKHDRHAGKKLLLACIDLIHQRGIPRIGYGRRYDEDPAMIFPHSLFGPDKMGFDEYKNSIPSASACLVVAGTNGAYAALDICKPGTLRPPILKL